MSDRLPPRSPNTARRGVRPTLARRALCIVALTGALMALAAAPSVAGATPSYVSLGDSYVSGPFILPPAFGARPPKTSPPPPSIPTSRGSSTR
jgi:hypothetical protein